MTSFGNLLYGNTLFHLEETNIYGIYESDSYMAWNIEMFPSGEDNYIMFNSLVIDNIFSPKQLNGKTFKETSDAADLYEHTVKVNGEDRFLKSVEMTFSNWDTENQSLHLNGHGTILEDDNFPEVIYKFYAILKFQGLNIFETTQRETQQFIDTCLQDVKDKLEIKFENVASGLTAIISGQF